MLGRGDRAAGDVESGTPEPRAAKLLLLGVCLAAAALLYEPAFNLGLLSDDFVLRAEGRTGEAFRVRDGRFYRPLASFLIGSWSPWLLHAAVIALHGANAWLVRQLGRAMGAARGTALAAAGLFLTFPAAVEAVGWISGIQDVLFATLALLFVLAWRLRLDALTHGTLVLVLQVLGLATKETATAFPLLGLAAWAFSPRLPTRRAALLAGLSGAAAVVYALWRTGGSGLPEAYAQPLSRYLLKEILVRTFGALAAPWHELLGPVGKTLGIVAGILFPLLLVANTRVWLTHRARLERALRFAALVLVPVAPVYSMLFIAPNLEGSRYVYAAAAGWTLLVAELFATATGSLRSGRWIGITAAVAWMATSAGATRAHLGPWQEAARARDRALRSAQRVVRDAGCQAMVVQAPPDSVDGAYVFRSGLEQALGLPLAATTPAQTRRCVLSWNGRRFAVR